VRSATKSFFVPLIVALAFLGQAGVSSAQQEMLPPPLPDLTVGEVGVKPGTGSGEYILDITITNAGDVAAAFQDVWIPDALQEPRRPGRYELLPRESLVRTLRVIVPTGQSEVTVVVDQANEVTESDETDNARRVVLAAGQPLTVPPPAATPEQTPSPAPLPTQPAATAPPSAPPVPTQTGVPPIPSPASAPTVLPPPGSPG
jgi:hypothetical protein